MIWSLLASSKILFALMSSLSKAALLVATDKAAFDKRDIKAKRILLDAIKDHIIPHISRKDYAH